MNRWILTAISFAAVLGVSVYAVRSGAPEGLKVLHQLFRLQRSGRDRAHHGDGRAAGRGGGVGQERHGLASESVVQGPSGRDGDQCRSCVRSPDPGMRIDRQSREIGSRALDRLVEQPHAEALQPASWISPVPSASNPLGNV